MSVMIPRNTTIPVKRTQQYETVADNQSSVLIKANAMNSLDDYVYKTRNALKNKYISSKLCSQEREKISSVITKATNLLDGDNQQDEMEVFEDSLKELVSLFDHIMGKNC
ncbi:Heat shock cognate 70 kDa protein 2 [Spatholobus suberectus]|nr:Heat shock cognate 70 kDa protein 2 [Spatholobus suberectus]